MVMEQVLEQKSDLKIAGLEDLQLRNFLLVSIFPAIAVTLLLTTSSELLHIIFGAVADAYLQVSTFVAATFLVIYGAERFLKIDATAALKRDTMWQVPIAAALGALPGCGGAVIVVTQFVTGRLSFGSVVATLTATMGDAAFLLLAQEPLTGLAMIGLGFSIGTLSGWAVNQIHHRDFLRGAKLEAECPVLSFLYPEDWRTQPIDKAWAFLLIPGIVVAVLIAFQIDVDDLFSTEIIQTPATLLGVVGGTVALSMRFNPRRRRGPRVQSPIGAGLLRRTVEDTNFITVWVIGAFLVFELSVYCLNLNLKGLFEGWYALTPIIAIVLGLLPGCGPQVLVTTMYLAGLIPLSAQIGNTISNDGDALFPAIAISPRVAIVATLYSTIPALILAYGWFFLFEL